MTCGACSSAVECALRGVDGVLSVEVALLAGQAKVPALAAFAWLSLCDVVTHVVCAQVVIAPAVVSDAAVVAAVEDCGFDGALLSAADEVPAAGVAVVAVSSPTRVVLEVEGMHCGSCTGACERALRAAPGVVTASVALLPPRAEVTYDANVTGARNLIAAVEDAGFVARLADRARPSADGARPRGGASHESHVSLPRASCVERPR